MRLGDRIRWDLRRLYHQLRKVLLRARIGDRWVDSGEVKRRIYPDYESYTAHQRTKFSAQRSARVIAHDRAFHEALSSRLRAMEHDFAGARVLCLGARQGTEVRCFIECGAFAVGIDLNPGPSNRYVVTGDFHELQFANQSIDVVFTNSLDHAFDLSRILAEARRVLRPDGLLLVEANAAEEGGASAGPYEALAWSSPEVLARQVERAGFTRIDQRDFELPWRGVQFVFRAGLPEG